MQKGVAALLTRATRGEELVCHAIASQAIFWSGQCGCCAECQHNLPHSFNQLSFTSCQRESPSEGAPSNLVRWHARVLQTLPVQGSVHRFVGQAPRRWHCQGCSAGWHRQCWRAACPGCKHAGKWQFPQRPSPVLPPLRLAQPRQQSAAESPRR